MGFPSSHSESLTQPLALSNKYGGFYAADTWRVNNKLRATAETTSHFDSGCHVAPALCRPRPDSSGRLPHTHKNAPRGVGTRQTQVSAPRWWLGSYFCAGPYPHAGAASDGGSYGAIWAAFITCQ